MFLWSAIFFKINFSKNAYQQCQTVWIQIRPYVLSGLGPNCLRRIEYRPQGNKIWGATSIINLSISNQFFGCSDGLCTQFKLKKMTYFDYASCYPRTVCYFGSLRSCDGKKWNLILRELGSQHLKLQVYIERYERSEHTSPLSPWEGAPSQQG